MSDKQFSRLLYGVLLVLTLCGCLHAASCPSPCKCSSSLKTINCANKKLHYVPGPFPNQSISIDLSGNLISLLQEEMFDDLPNLTHLDLSNNVIATMSSTVFRGCPGITQLSLKKNSLTSLSITNLPKLQILFVSQNRLTDIPKLSYVGQLKYLYLDTNLLTSVAFPSSYSQAYNLERITLSNNEHVGVIHRNDFQSLSTCYKLSRLLLSRCGITGVQPGSFSHFSRLASLSISINPLNMSTFQTILADFKDNKALMSLDFSANGLVGQITRSTFDALGKDNRLSTLDLSSSEYVTGVDDDAFVNLVYLVNLKVTGTGMPMIPDLKRLNRLSLLHLSSNSIKTISPNKLPSRLSVLHLDHNSISQIIESPFQHSARLTQLVLSHNQISRLSNNAMHGLSQLGVLDLSHNVLNSLPNNAFIALGNLTHLDLSSNNLQYVNHTVFDYTTALTKVYLNDNGMYSFNSSLFKPLANLTTLDLSNNDIGIGFSDSSLDYTGCLAGLDKLETVDMSYNSIQELPRNILAGTTQLEILRLSYNNINNWDTQKTFQGVSNLKSLYLNNNKLAVINQTSFDDFYNLTVLDLQNNPFACTCNMRDFRDWLKRTKVRVSNKQIYQCASPPYLRGTYVVEYDLNKIQCLPVWVWIVSGVAAGVIILLSLSCVLYRFRWKIRYRLYKCTCCLCCRSHSGYGVLTNSQPTYQYAAFLSHCTKERCSSLVHDSILPNISEDSDGRRSYPLIHEENLDPCKSRCAALDEALTTSASSVILICKHYRKDRMKELELEQAVHQREHEKKEIILLLTSDVQVTNAFKYIPPILQPIIIRNKHIEWNREDVQGPADKLRGELARVWRCNADANRQGGSDSDD